MFKKFNIPPYIVNEYNTYKTIKGNIYSFYHEEFEKEYDLMSIKMNILQLPLLFLFIFYISTIFSLGMLIFNSFLVIILGGTIGMIFVNETINNYKISLYSSLFISFTLKIFVLCIILFILIFTEIIPTKIENTKITINEFKAEMKIKDNLENNKSENTYKIIVADPHSIFECANYTNYKIFNEIYKKKRIKAVIKNYYIDLMGYKAYVLTDIVIDNDYYKRILKNLK